jgi:hypothetical protein
LFAQEHWIAEGSQGGFAGIGAAHTGGAVFGDLLFEMEVELLVELILGLSPAEKHPQTHGCLVEPTE